MKKFVSNRKMLSVILILVLILVFSLSIAYAIMSVTLNISGKASLSSSWGIRFQNPVVSAGSATDNVPVIVDSTSLSFSTILDMPGDYYEFTVEVNNYGTIDAIIDNISRPLDLTEEQSRYIKYDIKWFNGSLVTEKQSIGRGTVLKLIVRLEYRNDILASDLPSNVTNLDLSLKLNYVQNNSASFSSDGTAIGPAVDPNTFVIAYDKKYQVIPGYSLYDGIKQGIPIENVNKNFSAYEYFVDDGDSREYFLNEDLRVMNLMTTIVEYGKSYESTVAISTVNVVEDDLRIGNHNTVVIDIQPIINPDYSEPMMMPIFIASGDTYLNVCHAINFTANPFGSGDNASKLEQEILLGYILGYPAGQENGCGGTIPDHEFYVIIDENGEPIMLNKEVKHLDIATGVLISFPGDSMTFEEAKQELLASLAS